MPAPAVEPAEASVPTRPRSTAVMAGAAVAGIVVLAGLGWAIVRGLRSEPIPQPVIEIPIVEKAEPPPPPEPPVAPEPEPPPVTPEPERPPAGRKLGGKRVVLEYDARSATGTAPGPAPAGVEEQKPAPAARADESAPEVVRARWVYQQGNVKLFAGDASGAASDYLDALKIYPGYVASYRGLGFAYAEQGQKAKALDAFRIYVKTVPNARDAQLIRRRIEKLEKR